MRCVILLSLILCAPPVSAEDEATYKASAEKLLAEMRKELGPTFRYRAVRCFAVAGDASAARFDRVCRHTLANCYDAYQKQFFRRKPTRAYRVYLFKDADSYNRHVKKLFGRAPSTPFGYYSHAHRALVMNIGTGSGTLVHEMFHALVVPDFPDIPLWANEGIASLFEQCRITDDGLVGLVNWRLPIVQGAIRKNELRSLRKMMTMTDMQFRVSGGGSYAAARYFMMYLQEKKVLVQFYRKFRDGYNKDKTGVAFVEEVLGRKLEEVEPEWRKWVMGLRR